MASKTTSLIRQQAPMTKMLYALAPIALSGVYFYGWRVLLLLIVVNLFGFLSEYAFARVYKEPVTMSVFVTSVLFCLSLPPAIPIWMAVVGVVFGVVFGKMVFGGFGRNVFNPALVGRAFLYISFGNEMTGRWSEPVGGVLGGFGAYAVEAVTQATPGMTMKLGEATSLLPLFLGNISGVIGGTSALLVLIGGIYIVQQKIANYRLVVSCLVGYALMQTIFWLGPVGGVDPLRSMLGGSLLFGAFFFVTEPVSACKTNEGRWIYGAFVGVMSSMISVLSPWPAGTMFAILLANTFAPITDYAIQEWKTKRKAKAA